MRKWPLILLLLAPAAAEAQRAQPTPIQCWPVPNGSNNTMKCSNGYWRTITPDGEEYSGNGVTDPNASMQGSTINIDPATGGVNINPKNGPSVSPGSQMPAYNEPGQAQMYGQYPHVR